MKSPRRLLHALGAVCILILAHLAQWAHAGDSVEAAVGLINATNASTSTIPADPAQTTHQTRNQFVLYFRYSRPSAVQRTLRMKSSRVLVYGRVATAPVAGVDHAVDGEWFSSQKPLFTVQIRPLRGVAIVRDESLGIEIARVGLRGRWLTGDQTVAVPMTLQPPAKAPSAEAFPASPGERFHYDNLDEAGRRNLTASEHWLRLDPFHATHQLGQTIRRLLSGTAGTAAATAGDGPPLWVVASTLQPRWSLAAPGFWWEVLGLNRTWASSAHFVGLGRVSRLECAGPSAPEPLKVAKPVRLADLPQRHKPEPLELRPIVPPPKTAAVSIRDLPLDPDALPNAPAGPRTGGADTPQPFSTYPLDAETHFARDCRVFQARDKATNALVASIVPRLFRDATPGVPFQPAGFQLVVHDAEYWPDWLFISSVLGVRDFRGLLKS